MSRIVVALQMTLCVVLLVGGGLLIRSLRPTAWVLEEVAFRGVLWALISRLRSPIVALLTTSG